MSLLLFSAGVVGVVLSVFFLLAGPSSVRQYAEISLPAIDSQAAAETRNLDVASDLEGAATPTIARSITRGLTPEPPGERASLEELRTVPIAHETPHSVVFGSVFDVTLAIDATGDKDAAEALPGEENVFVGKAQVLDTVQALVSGTAFDVEAVSPEVQTLSPLTENVWRWRASAKEAGEQHLNIELFALDGTSAMPLKTFRNVVRVEVSQVRQIIDYADMANPVFVLLGGFGSMIAGLFGFARFFRFRKV